MGFKKTTDGRVFFKEVDNTANDSTDSIPMRERPLTGAQDDAIPPNASATPRQGHMQLQVLSLLKSLNERLKTTQAERDFMRKTMDEYKTTIDALENKAEASTQAYQGLEQKMYKLSREASAGGGSGSAKTEEFIRDTLKEMEKSRRLLMTLESKAERANQGFESLKKSQTLHVQKLARTTSDHNKVIQRMNEHDDRHAMMHDRLNDALVDQKRLEQQINDIVEDRQRFMRKIERIEETVLQTRDTLNAKALAITVDDAQHSDARLNDALLARADAKIEEPLPAALRGGPRVMDALDHVTRSSTAKMVIMPLLLFTAVAVGIYVGSTNTQPDLSMSEAAYTQATSQQEFIVPPAAAPTALTQSTIDQTLNSVNIEHEEHAQTLFEENPQELARRLNNIAPGEVSTAATESVQPAADQPASPAPLETAPEKQDAPIAKAAPPVQNYTPAQAPETIAQDPNLPDMIKNVEAQAIEGSPEAQHDLAAIYVAGHAGAPQDYERAVLWFRKAADQGVPNAAYNLGVLHHQGLGVKTNIDEAIYWYRQAAERNHPEAQYNLGIAYIEGIGVPYIPTSAAEYFEQAAKNGVIEAAYNLGLIHENGLLGEPQPDEALVWYKRAADKGSPEAKTALELLAQSTGLSLSDVNTLAEEMGNLSIGTAPDTITSAAPAQSALSEDDTLAAVEKELEQIMIAQIQQVLMNKGLYPGPADGIAGPLSRDAIRAYQESNGLEVTGEASETLLEFMNR